MLASFRQLAVVPRPVWLLCIGAVLNRLGSMVLPFLAIYLVRGRGFDSSTVALVLGAWGVGGVLAGPLGGALLDRVAPLWVLRGSLFCTGLLMLVYPHVQSLWALVPLTVLTAFVADAFRPAVLVMLTQAVPAQHTRMAFTVYRLAINLGESIGPAVGGVLATISYTLLFVVDGLTSLLAAGWMLLAMGVPKTAVPATRRNRTSRGPLADRRFLLMIAGTLLCDVVFLQLMGAVSLYLVGQAGLTEVHFGLLWTVNTVLIVVAEVPLNVATQAWPLRRLLVVGTLLVGSGVALMGLVYGLAQAALAMVVLTCGEMVLFPTMSAAVAHMAPEDRRGAYMGLHGMTFSLAWALAPVLGTNALAYGGPGVFFGGGLALCMVAAALMWMAARNLAQPPTDAATTTAA